MKYLSVQGYKWMIVFAGMLGLFGALGLGRFSLGMMLPSMGEGIGLTYGQMGMISTANFCGYLFAVLLSGKLNRRFGSRILVFLGLLLIGCSMLCVGRVNGFLPVLLLYSLTGIGSALANIPIMVLIAVWFEPQLRGRAAGLCVMGNGLGILASGRTVPVVNELGNSWQTSWLVFGTVIVAIAFVCLAILRNQPAGDRPGTTAAASRSKDSLDEKPDSKGMIYLCAAIYFIFGFTYVIYVTFFVTFLVQERGYTEYVAGVLWAWGGLISVLSGPLFGYLSDKAGRKNGLMVVFSIQAVAYLCAVWVGFGPAVYLSVFLFSLVAFSVPTIVAALVGDLAGPQKAAAVFGFVTFVFGIGQIAGPAVAGALAESVSGFSAAFLMSSLLVTVGAVLSAFLKQK